MKPTPEQLTQRLHEAVAKYETVRAINIAQRDQVFKIMNDHGRNHRWIGRAQGYTLCLLTTVLPIILAIWWEQTRR